MSSSTRMQAEVAEAEREHGVKTIGTHGGLFHCDEVLACYMLKVLPEYKDARYMYMYMYMYIRACSTNNLSTQLLFITENISCRQYGSIKSFCLICRCLF